MNRFTIILCLSLIAVIHLSAAHAADRVRTTERPIPGNVQSVSATKIVVNLNGNTTEYPVNQIESISFDGEPAVLTTARTNLGAGRYEDVIEALADLKVSEIARKEIRQDIEFYRAYCAGQLALSGKSDIRKAGSQVSAFLKANVDSYHYLDAQMLYGDLGAAAGSPAAAQGAYIKVGQMAPWPDYKARAAVALGFSYLKTGQTAQASSMFKSALGMSDPSPAVQRQKLAATLGEAQCLAADGQVEDAAKAIQDVIRQADNDDLPLLAKAHNALGASYHTAKQPKDALMAYLWVDLVYFNSPQDHIEALENLVRLWNEQQMPERSSEAAQTLRERYNQSPR